MASSNAEVYDSAPIEINTAHWSEYTAELRSVCDDDDCTFFCNLQGVGMVWIDQIHMGPADGAIIKEKTLKAFETLSIPVLRFPGGCVTTVYHWKYGTGPAYLRPVTADPVFKREIRYEFGTDEYLQMCLRLRIRPQITVNISTGTPEEAREWAQYCAQWYQSRGMEPPEMYWQIGNEHNGHWEIGNMTGEMYVRTLREFVPGIREAYPKARIIALGTETAEGMFAQDRVKWREIVLDQAAEYFDLLAVQCYQTSGWSHDKAQQHYAGLEGIAEIKSTLQGIIDDVSARGLDKKAAITEWNLWYHAAHHRGRDFYEPYDVQHGLYVAAAFHVFIGLAPEVELANFFNLLNTMGIFISHGPEVKETALAEIFRLYRSALPGTVVRLDVSAPSLPTGAPSVDAVCVDDGEFSWLFCINLHASEDCSVELRDFKEPEEGVTLAGDGVEGQFRKTAASISGNRLTLPPLSIARLRMKD